MKLTRVMLTGALLTCASTAWAQNQSEASPTLPAAQVGSNDVIVRMRQSEAAANQAYRRKVAAAKKVYDGKKAQARKERDAAITAARAEARTN